MAQAKKIEPKEGSVGQNTLKANVWDAGLCTGCGACVGICPYQGFWGDRTRPLFSCDVPDDGGRCSAFCPRWNLRLGEIYSPPFADGSTSELGRIRGYLLARASDPALRAKAQHGGTLSALLALGLAQGFVDVAVVAGKREDLAMTPALVSHQEEVISYAGSTFLTSPTVSGYHAARKAGFQRIGVVATPCQAQSLAKIRSVSERFEDRPGDALSLVLGVFCGWTLSLGSFKDRLKALGVGRLVAMDIPAGRGTLEILGESGLVELPFDRVEPMVREACACCLDTTAELADISVGSARTNEPWEEMRTWNQVLIRSERGETLFSKAVELGVVEVREAPKDALEALKAAARAKKQKALRVLRQKAVSGSKLGYLDTQDPSLPKFLEAIETEGANRA